MPISLVCPTCGTKMKAPDTAVGKKVKCPKCASLVEVTEEAGEATAAISSTPPPAEPEPKEDEVEDLDEVPEASDGPADGDLDEVEDEGTGKKKKRDKGPLREDDKQWGMFAHLAGIFSWLGALIVFLMKKDESAFLRHHTKESLNFQLTLLPLWLLFPFGICCGGCMGGILDAAAGTYGLIRLGVTGVMGLFLFALWAGNLALVIMAGLKAKKGEWNKYPFAFRLIK